MRSCFLPYGSAEIHYTDWGPKSGRPVLMWHGLTRTCRDFDTIAGHFAVSGHRVICPDTLGRGLSSWSDDPAAQYNLPYYLGIAEALLDSLGLMRVLWLGTSMGGLLGMLASATGLRERITRLVINDVGPQVPESAFNRIRSYAAIPPSFTTVSACEAFLRRIYASFGAISDDEWRVIVETSIRRNDAGHWTLHYDPRLVEQLPKFDADSHLWALWAELSCPTLVLRGVDSDVLPHRMMAEMCEIREGACQAVTVPGCGHAPYLNTNEQIKPIEAFLFQS